MATPNDPNISPRHPGHETGFPADRPVEALLRDHELVRRLADAWLNDASAEARRQAGIQMLQALEMHSRLEESVFYPAVRDVDPSMIAHFEDEHHKTDDLLSALKRSAEGDPQRETLMRDLIDSTLRHIREEEDEFFPKLAQANIDLVPIGLQMQSFEANLVHMAAQASDQGTRRR